MIEQSHLTRIYTLYILIHVYHICVYNVEEFGRPELGRARPRCECIIHAIIL